jgi:uncharacterized membrane protein YhdT
MNSFGVLQALVFEPKKAFAEIAERPRILFPLLLLIVATAGVTFWFYQVVDLGWLTDRQLRAGGGARQMTDEQIATMVKAAGEHPGVAGAITAFVTALAIVIAYTLVSLYYLLAGKITNVQRSFSQWFALSCWCNLPTLLTAITSAIVLATTTSTQFDDAELKVLSLNALFFHHKFGEPGYALLSAIGLPELLTMYLSVLGVRVWSGRSWTFSAIFTLLPVALILGVVALFTLGRS